MKSRLHHLEIQNFKAFREFSLKLEGRHLLLYGPNGSGKSSLYWAIYTFLQSANKIPRGSIAKYFDPDDNENLLNIHEQAGDTPKAGEIALTLRDIDTTIESTYRINQADHSTYKETKILKGDLASDFITYRFFFGFSHFRNSQKFDLWPLFEKEILPFCVSTGGKDPIECWKAIQHGNPNPGGSRGQGGANAYETFRLRTNDFSAILSTIVDSISDRAQKFYDEHFAEGDPAKVTLTLKVTTPPSASGATQKEFRFSKPVIDFGIQIDSETIARPQSFLNEAKLTQLALSVRFAASLVNLNESDLKLLVLDDLLVSLDMDNRMKVVDILLSPTFANYQKIILTHDLGFFNEFRRMVATDHTNWCFRTLQGNPKDGIEEIEDKAPLEKAADYLHGHDIEAAAHQLRKAAENTAKQYRRVAIGDEPARGEFHSLTEDLRLARKHLLQQIPFYLYEKAIAGIPESHRDKLVSITDNDIDSDDTLDDETKGKIKCQRKRLKQFFTHDAWKNLEAIESLDAVINMKDRILNPAAHWNEAPLYESEVKKAFKHIERLKSALAAI